MEEPTAKNTAPQHDSDQHDADTPQLRGRVAVVEDGEATRHFLVQSLRGQGYQVKGIEDGASALPLLRLHQPEVILLDVSLPGLDGFGVCRQIRQDDLLRDAVVIMLTGRASGDDRQQAWLAGADDYLIKPCDIPELLARVAAHLRRREQPQAQWLNPITRLAAPAALTEDIQGRIQRGAPFTAISVDIAHFKSYNQRYGYQAGDALLAMVADMIRAIAQDISAQARDDGAVTAGHLGSDDFVLLTPPALVTSAEQLLTQGFAELAPSLYHGVDRARGWVPGIDASGVARVFPLATLHLASLPLTPADFATLTTPGAVATFTAGLWRRLRDLTNAPQQERRAG